MNKTWWSVVVPESTDKALRTYLVNNDYADKKNKKNNNVLIEIEIRLLNTFNFLTKPLQPFNINTQDN